MIKRTLKITSILGLAFIGLNTTLKAEVDYSKNSSYYQNLCSKKSSFNANKKTCQGYENYLTDLKKKAQNSEKNLKSTIKETENDISKTLDAVKENEKLINIKTKQIEMVSKEIETIKKNISDLEQELLERIALVQEINTENFIIDFITSSINLNDFLIKMNGINVINASNAQIADDLNDQRQALVKNENDLKEEEKSLKEAKAKQEVLLKNYYSKEAELFKQLEESRKAQAHYNSKIDGLNLADLEEELNNSNNNNNNNNNNNSKPSGSGSSGSNSSKPGNSSKLGIPVDHAVVTAASWYYPASFGGGWHPGVDLANNTGTKVKSPGKGVLLATGWEAKGYGNYIVTAHQVGNDTYTFIYGHLNSIANIPATLDRNTLLGYMGSTGNSTGPHTHVEIIKHANQNLTSVVSKYKRNYDIHFGIGYGGTNGNNAVRIKPHEYFGIKMGQSF